MGGLFPPWPIISFLLFSLASGASRDVPLCGSGALELLEKFIEGGDEESTSSPREYVVALPSVGDNVTVLFGRNQSDFLEPIHCELRVQSCPSCLLRLVIATRPNRQIPSTPPTCDDEQPDEPCFSLTFVEERAGTNTRGDPDRTTSLWAMLDEAQSEVVSTGDSISIVLQAWALDDRLRRFARGIFPLRVSSIDNSASVWGVPSGGDAMSNATAVGYIESPRFPSAYPTAVVKTYVIENRKADGSVRLVFDDFNINSNSEIEVLDSDDSELFSTRSDFRRPPALASTGSQVRVLFKGHDFTDDPGFRARYEFVNNSQWDEKPTNELCDETLDAFGGELKLDGRTELLDQYVDCVFIIQHRDSPPGRAYDRLFLRVEEFRVRGENVRLEVREGPVSTGDRLLSLYDAQATEALLAKQPRNGFVVSTDDPAYYIRLRGLLRSTTGMHITYSQFYRWAGPVCPGTGEFHCANQRCIKASLRCDGFDHCGDGSDEACESDGGLLLAGTGGGGGGGGGSGGKGEESDISALLALVLGVCGIVVLLLVTVTVVLKLYDRRRHDRRRRRVQTVDASGARLPHHPEVAPSMQTVGERRFYVLPETQISVIEAPPCYDDALKHPAVPVGRMHSAAFSNDGFVEEESPSVSPRPPTPKDVDIPLEESSSPNETSPGTERNESTSYV